MLQTKNNDRPVYQGFQDTFPNAKYLTFSDYDVWIFSNSVSGTGAAIYRMGKENCPIQTDGWSYVDGGSWYSGHQKITSEITLKCAEIPGNVIKQTPPTKAATTTPTTTTTTITTTTKTVPTTQATVLSSWSQWTADCGGINCGEGKNKRSRQ